MSAHEKIGIKKPENGCFCLEQKRLILRRKRLVKWFYAMAPLKEESVHWTKTTIFVLKFLFENVTLIVYIRAKFKKQKQKFLIFWLNISFCCPGAKSQPICTNSSNPEVAYPWLQGRYYAFSNRFVESKKKIYKVSVLRVKFKELW